MTYTNPNNYDFETGDTLSAATMDGLIDNDQYAVNVLNELDAKIETKQDELTFDTSPTSGSGNPVTSGGIYSAIAESEQYVKRGYRFYENDTDYLKLASFNFSANWKTYRPTFIISDTEFTHAQALCSLVFYRSSSALSVRSFRALNMGGEYPQWLDTRLVVVVTGATTAELWLAPADGMTTTITPIADTAHRSAAEGGGETTWQYEQETHASGLPSGAQTFIQTWNLADATASDNGFMTAADKTKLNGIATGATAVTVDSTLSTSSSNAIANSAVATAINTLNTQAGLQTYQFAEHVSGDNACTAGWVDTVQKTYTFTGLIPGAQYRIEWACAWVRNNTDENSATAGECNWKTNNGGYFNGVVVPGSGKNQAFVCSGYATADSSGELTTTLWSHSGGVWASKVPYFNWLKATVFRT